MNIKKYKLNHHTLKIFIFSIIASIIPLISNSYATNSNRLSQKNNIHINSSIDIPGWPEYLAMGTVTNFNSAVTDTFSKGSKLDFLFGYASYDNAGPVSKIAPDSTTDMYSTNTIISQANLITNNTGALTQPVITVYNLNLSEGYKIDGSNVPAPLSPDDYNWDNQSQSQWGFQNLILNAQALSKATPSTSNDAKYGVIILNPDFLGQIALDKEETYQFKNINISQAVTSALKAENIQPKNTPVFTNDVNGFIEANNYILSTYFSSITYGWVVNAWAGGSSNFVHGSSTDVKNNINAVNTILDNTGVYTSPYKPDFIAFDKYEANDYSTLTNDINTQGTNNVINLGYLYNARDLHNYLSYVGGVSSHEEKPAVLWQIPGGHLIQSTGDSSDAATIGAEGDYVFGSGLSGYTPSLNVTNPDVSLKFLQTLNLSTSMPAIYNFNGNLENYLTMDQNGNIGKYNWTNDNTKEIVDNNIVAILWGGGSTTGVVDNIAEDRSDQSHTKTLSDNKWLMNAVQNYYKSPQNIS